MWIKGIRRIYFGKFGIFAGGKADWEVMAGGNAKENCVFSATPLIWVM